MNTRRRPSRSATTESTLAPTNMPANPAAITSALPVVPSLNSVANTGASTPPRNTSYRSKNDPRPTNTTRRQCHRVTGSPSRTDDTVVGSLTAIKPPRRAGAALSLLHGRHPGDGNRPSLLDEVAG